MKIIYGEIPADANSGSIVEQKIGDTTIKYIGVTPVIIETEYIKFDVLIQSKPHIQLHKFHGEINIPYSSLQFLVIDGVDYSPFIKNRKLYRSMSEYTTLINSKLTDEQQYNVFAGLYPPKNIIGSIMSEIQYDIKNEEHENKLLGKLDDLIIAINNLSLLSVPKLGEPAPTIVKNVLLNNETISESQNNDIVDKTFVPFTPSDMTESLTIDNSEEAIDNITDDETVEESNAENNNSDVSQDKPVKKAGRPKKN